MKEFADISDTLSATKASMPRAPGTTERDVLMAVSSVRQPTLARSIRAL
jgi:hypothetical protein